MAGIVDRFLLGEVNAKIEKIGKRIDGLSHDTNCDKYALQNDIRELRRSVNSLGNAVAATVTRADALEKWAVKLTKWLGLTDERNAPIPPVCPQSKGTP